MEIKFLPDIALVCLKTKNAIIKVILYLKSLKTQKNRKTARTELNYAENRLEKLKKFLFHVKHL